MSVEAKLKLQIGEFTKNYDTAVNHAKKGNAGMERSTAGLGASMSSGFKGLMSSGLARLGGVAAAGAVALDSLRSAMTRQSQVAGLTGVSLENVSDQIERLEEMAKLPGLGFDQALQGSIKLQAVGQSASQAEAIIREMGNALALVGGGSQDLEGVILAITQIISKGKVSAEEINQIAERLPQVRALMKEAFGTADTDALQKMGIESEVFIDGLVTAASGLPRATATSKTEFENLKDAWKSLMVELGSGPEGMLGDLFGGLSKGLAGIEDWVDKVKSSWSGLGEWISDFSAGGITYANDQMIRRDTDAAQKKGEGDDILAAKRAEKEADDAKAAASKQQAAALEEEKEKAEELAEAMETLAALKEKLAANAIDILPDDQKLEALKGKLAAQLGGSVGSFSLNYETSTAGLEKLAKDREANKDLPASGANSAAEAYGWLEEARKLEADIGKTEEKIAADKKKAADEEAGRQKELADLRASAEEGRVGLLSEEDQTKAMRDRLASSLGIKISGGDDIARGLKLMRMEVDSARKGGDAEGEKAALERLNEAQRQAAEFQQRIGGGGGAPGKQGEFQTLVDEIFNRDPAAEQLRAMEDSLRKQDDLKRTMDDILKKMDEPVPRDTFGFEAS